MKVKTELHHCPRFQDSEISSEFLEILSASREVGNLTQFRILVAKMDLKFFSMEFYSRGYIYCNIFYNVDGKRSIVLREEI